MSKPFFHDERLCKGCERLHYTVDIDGGKDKWFCFGTTSSEARKEHHIPTIHIYRFCVKHPPTKELPIKNLFQLNMHEEEMKEIVRGSSNY